MIKLLKPFGFKLSRMPDTRYTQRGATCWYYASKMVRAFHGNIHKLPPDQINMIKEKVNLWEKTPPFLREIKKLEEPTPLDRAILKHRKVSEARKEETATTVYRKDFTNDGVFDRVGYAKADLEFLDKRKKRLGGGSGPFLIENYDFEEIDVRTKAQLGTAQLGDLLLVRGPIAALGSLGGVKFKEGASIVDGAPESWVEAISSDGEENIFLHSATGLRNTEHAVCVFGVDIELDEILYSDPNFCYTNRLIAVPSQQFLPYCRSMYFAKCAPESNQAACSHVKRHTLEACTRKLIFGGKTQKPTVIGEIEEL